MAPAASEPFELANWPDRQVRHVRPDGGDRGVSGPNMLTPRLSEDDPLQTSATLAND
jgi:hypothetical protein